MSSLIVFAALLAVWCAVHSLLATYRCKRRLAPFFGRDGRYYRLAYNLFSLATLWPLLFWGWALPATPVVSWEGPWRVLRTLLWATAALFVVGGCRSYDLAEFAGLKRSADTDSVKCDEGRRPLVTSGILGVVRHPWYTAAFIVLWARDLDLSALTVSVVFSIYLAVGAHLEENRLVGEFGDAYRRYRERVPMFIPWKRPLKFLRRR